MNSQTKTGKRAEPRDRAADQKKQSKLFIEKAREIGADEQSDSSADELIGRLAKMPTEPRKGSKSRR